MPDANLFRQNAAGVVFWTGVFDKDPVALFIESKSFDYAHVAPPFFKLYKITQLGSLVEMCEFRNGSGMCNITHRLMKLQVQIDSMTAYISTIEKPKPKPAEPSRSEKDRSREESWKKQAAGAGIPPGFSRDWFDQFFRTPYNPGAGPVNFNTGGVSGTMYDEAGPLPGTPRPLDPLIDCFKFLGLHERPSEDEIKAAWRPKMKEWHPDRHPNNQTEAEQKTRDYCTAYEECMRRMGYRQQTEEA